VGIGTVLIAARYEQLCALSQAEVDKRLLQVELPDWSKTRPRSSAPTARLHRASQKSSSATGRWSQQTSTHSRIKSASTGGDPPDCYKRTPAQRIIELLEQVNAPSRVRDIGLSAEDEADALRDAQYLRSQFTITSWATCWVCGK